MERQGFINRKNRLEGERTVHFSRYFYIDREGSAELAIKKAMIDAVRFSAFDILKGYLPISKAFHLNVRQQQYDIQVLANCEPWTEEETGESANDLC